jgi:hypothetical protein
VVEGAIPGTIPGQETQAKKNRPEGRFFYEQITSPKQQPKQPKQQPKQRSKQRQSRLQQRKQQPKRQQQRQRLQQLVQLQELELQRLVLEQQQALLFCCKQPKQQPTGR